jgi:chromosome segregation ATPase
MANLNNIEKLIQMATIEHMYEMLQKIKNDITLNQLSDTIFESSTPLNSSNNFLPTDDDNYKNEVKNINDTISIIKSDNANLMKIIDTILMKIYSLESEIKELKSENDKLSCELKKMNELSSSETSKGGHITLKIEEKNIDTSENLAKNTDGMIDKIKQLEQEVEEEEEDQEVEEEEEDQEVEEEEEDQEVEEEDEQQEEEEVGTDEEEDVEQKELKKEEQHESLEEDDEDEEVFEIEIDDITYFTTDEENGILYEVTSDEEVGKKVGIIKNGEPIFS